jgi:TonB family protein
MRDKLLFSFSCESPFIDNILRPLASLSLINRAKKLILASLIFLVLHLSAYGSFGLIQIRLLRGELLDSSRVPDSQSIESLNIPLIQSSERNYPITEQEIRTNITEALSDSFEFKTIEDLFSFTLLWNDNDKELTESVVQFPSAYKFIIHPRWLSKQQIAINLTIFFKEIPFSPTMAIHQQKKIESELNKAVSAWDAKKTMSQVVSHEFNTMIFDPSILTFKIDTQTYFLFVTITDKAQPTYIEMVAPLGEDKNDWSAGLAKYRLTIDNIGKVQNIDLVDSSNIALDYRVMKSMKKWEFEPIRKKGKNTSIRFNYSIDFAFLRRRPQESQSLEPVSAYDDKLGAILKGSADYAKKLSNYCLGFVCEENIKETIYNFFILTHQKQQGQNVKIINTTGSESVALSSRAQALSIDPFKTQINRNRCDYQMIMKQGRLYERRIILKERKPNSADEINYLEEPRYSNYRSLFMPERVLDLNMQSHFIYKLLNDSNVQNRETYVLKALSNPKNPSPIAEATIWIEKKSLRIVKIEINEAPPAGYEFILKDAIQLGLDPQFRITAYYSIEQEDILYPNEVEIISEFPLNVFGHSKRTKLKTTIHYNKYRYFKVTTEHGIIR